jgi:ADP-ribose pyrophosphatase YjhB (NUDIX family)
MMECSPDWKVLLIGGNSGSIKGQWGIPWGVVEVGESPEAAVLREALADV